MNLAGTYFQANRGYLKEIAQYEAGEISRDVENKKYVFKHRLSLLHMYLCMYGCL